jgi:hypothetical protein
MSTQAAKKPKRRVLAFNARKKLVATFGCPADAAHILNVDIKQIYFACDDVIISLRSKKLYLRWWDREINIEVLEELGVLTLQEYDEIYGQPRKIYANSKMKKNSLE